MIARFLANVKVRAGPSSSTGLVAEYYKGQTVKYDQTEIKEGRKWISFLDNSGIRRYCCVYDIDGEPLIELGVDDDDDDENDENISQTVLASYFDDEIGYKNNYLNDGGYYYAELSKDPAKKDYSALGITIWSETKNYL